LIEARNKLSFGAPERFCTIYTWLLSDDYWL
jgi:hypothetical protein